MDFVDVINFEPGTARPQAHIGAKFTHGIDASVAGTVDLNHVNVLPNGDGLTGIAFIAGFVGGADFAIQAFGENSRHAGFAHTTCASKEIGMGDAVKPDSVAKGSNDVFLTDQIIKCLGAISPGHNLVRGGG
jgi:hypothetical protein